MPQTGFARIKSCVQHGDEADKQNGIGRIHQLLHVNDLAAFASDEHLHD